MIEPRLPIVDDQAPLRYAVRDFFAAIGWDVDCAGSVDEAAAALASREYGAVIADLQLAELARVLDCARRTRGIRSAPE